MTAEVDRIKFLWTHKTQDHTHFSDEELLIVKGEGVHLWTHGGRKLIDGFSGLAVVNCGHGRREIADAVRDQMMQLEYYPTTRQFSNGPASALAEKLASLTPGDLRYTFFASSGSEANERSMQIARHYWLKVGKPGKYKIISMLGGYHGATMADFNICGIPAMAKAYEPVHVAGFAKVKSPYPFLDRGNGTDEDLVDRCANGLREAILREGPDTISAVILEPIQSSSGFVVPPQGWLQTVRDLCDEYDILMIADEVITGFGRTGHWFGCDHDGVVPDLMSMAKGITSGYVPLSASVARARLADVFPEDSKASNVHPTTYAGHPTACAAALANIAIMEREGLVENAARMGARLMDTLKSNLAGCPMVGEVRGRGLMVCLEMVQPGASPAALEPRLLEDLNAEAYRRGAVVFSRERALRLAPPLCITAKEVDELAGIVIDVTLDMAKKLRAPSRVN